MSPHPPRRRSSTSSCRASTRRRPCRPARRPAGRLPRHRRRQRLDRRQPRDRPRSRGPVVHEARRGYGSAVHAGLLVATAPVVAFCDADGSFDPRRPTDPRGPGARRRGRPRALPPPPDGSRGLARCTPGSPTGSSPPGSAASPACRCTTSGRCGSLAGSRCSPSTCRTAAAATPWRPLLRAHAAGWRILEIDVPYTPRLGRSKVTGTGRGTSRRCATCPGCSPSRDDAATTTHRHHRRRREGVPAGTGQDPAVAALHAGAGGRSSRRLASTTRSRRSTWSPLGSRRPRRCGGSSSSTGPSALLGS